ncbi:MAG: molybdopterin-dependent oxidoreductase [Actinomycetota bacterium]|nr:molybdopterin-dependent oxidoreductase [Actinomycetota bacterium]
MKTKGGLTRAQFLALMEWGALGLSLGGFGFISGCATKSRVKGVGEKSTTELINTVCRICGPRCGMTASIEGDRIEKLEGWKEFKSKGYLCPMGLSLKELVYAPDRLKYPMKKEGNDWKRISWDEALDIIAEKLNGIKKEYGAEAVDFHFGKALVAQESRYYMERLCNAFGTPNYSSVGSQCHGAKLMGYKLTYGCIPKPDYKNTKCIIVWGCNPEASDPLAAESILKAKEGGAKLIVIDPIKISLTKEADVHLQVRPGTDGALALSMLNVIISENLYDKEFVENWTVGFDKLVDLVKGYSPEKVSEIAWIPADMIREAARMYGSNKPACICQGNALDLHTNTVQMIRSVAILQAVCGNLDVAGGGLVESEAKLADISLAEKRPEVKPVGAAEHPLFYEFRYQAQANHLPEAILSEDPYPIRAMVVVGGNPLLTGPNANKMRKALKKLDFVVVMDLFMTPTAEFADIVLPAATFFERADLVTRGKIMFLDKVIPEYEESRPDWKFIFELGKKLGYEEYFPWKDAEEAFDHRLAPLGITVEQLKKEPLGIALSEEGYKKYEKNGFKTPSKKVEIYSEKLEKFGYDPLPVYVEPNESPVSKPNLAEEYSLVLTSGARIPVYMHTMMRNIKSLRKMVPDPVLNINPKKAKELKIEDGDGVVVETLRGGIEVKAKFTKEIDPRVVHVPHGWSDPANVNVLTDDEVLDPISGFPAYKSLLCRARKKA